MLTIGIDAGSRTTKIVLFDAAKRSILFSDYTDTGIHPTIAVEGLINTALSRMNLELEQIGEIYSTGYSRSMVEYAGKTISEITCHAVGVKYFLPDTRFIIDVGGQDSKVITIGEDGKVADFAMNDKCAAGTGRFLEVTARILNCDVSELSELSTQSDKEIDINSTCVVFAESEIIGMISQGNTIPNIINAVQRSIAKRLVHLASQVRWMPPVVFTGGVARNKRLVELCAEELKKEIKVPEHPTITAALGAAILASLKKNPN
ncbi:MAG TPA: acyl-CoA dehydratase activase [Candidatus Cloacimonadota bacterium]|nr:acyl-CoA dehydratase activase [Candidatus Cloacimonadota bacterium]HPT73038.1 acyl-CoA dehydratase activase [Candidatus Cloacimonadota bacterium]